MGEAVPALERIPGPVLERVTRFVESERLLRGVTRVLMSVSGGPDSLAVLFLLCRLRERLSFELVAAHFDHQLREDSAADRAWVRELCGALGIDCLTAEGDVSSFARERRIGIEEAARILRYRFLAFAAGKQAADCVATGHTADDQAETVLMHILRGSGIRGLRGMLPSAQVPGAPAMRLIRPGLPVSASETASICEVTGVEPRRDPSNHDMSYLRNRIHHETLPALRNINPAVDDSLRRLGAHAREAFRPVERAAEGLRPLERGEVGALYSLAEFRALPAEARTLVVERELAAAKLEPNVNSTLIRNLDQVLRAGRGRVHFGEGEVEASAGTVRVGPSVEDEEQEAVVLNVPGTTVAGSWRVLVASTPWPEEGAVNGITPDGVLRARAPGPADRVLVRGRRRRLKRIVAEEQVPAWERRRALVVTDSRGIVAAASPSGWRCGGGEGPDGLSLRFERIAGAAPTGPHGRGT